jgi:hypothetical protein
VLCVVPSLDLFLHCRHGARTANDKNCFIAVPDSLGKKASPQAGHELKCMRQAEHKKVKLTFSLDRAAKKLFELGASA